MKKVIYFSAGYDLTDDEAAELAALNAIGAAALEINVSNGAVDPGIEGGVEACDYAAGTVPTAYSEVATFDIDTPPTARHDPGNTCHGLRHAGTRYRGSDVHIYGRRWRNHGHRCGVGNGNHL